jgi:hypothetical protein
MLSQKFYRRERRKQRSGATAYLPQRRFEARVRVRPSGLVKLLHLEPQKVGA